MAIASYGITIISYVWIKTYPQYLKPYGFTDFRIHTSATESQDSNPIHDIFCASYPQHEKSSLFIPYKYLTITTEISFLDPNYALSLNYYFFLHSTFKYVPCISMLRTFKTLSASRRSDTQTLYINNTYEHVDLSIGSVLSNNATKLTFIVNSILT